MLLKLYININYFLIELFIFFSANNKNEKKPKNNLTRLLIFFSYKF